MSRRRWTVFIVLRGVRWLIVCVILVGWSCVFVPFIPMAEGEADILSLAHSNYDQAKELFAINVHGCSLMDILSTILISPLLCTIYQGLCDLLFKSHVRYLLSVFNSSGTTGVRSLFSMFYMLFSK